MSEVKDAIKDGLNKIVGAKGVSSDTATLEKYSRDQSFTPARKPHYVVKPKSLEELQNIVKFANEQLMPLVPRSSATDFHGGSVPTQGGIVVDLSQMNKISELDTFYHWVSIGPGLTFAQLKEELDKHDLRLPTPLMAPPSASALISYVEREPVPCAADFIYGNEQMQTMRVVIPNGDSFTMGNPAVEGAPHSHIFGPGLNFYRMFMCAEGTLGTVYEINVRVIPKPKAQKVFFVAFANAADVIGAMKRIQRQELGFECFALNSFDLATLAVDEDAADTKSLKQGSYIGNTGAKPWSQAQRKGFETLRHALPPWTLVITLTGWARHPEEKVQYQELDLRDLSAEVGFELKPSVGGISGLGKIIEEEMLLPWRMQKRFGYRGSCHGLMFYSTGAALSKIEEAIAKVAAKYNYSWGDVGAYVQPVERARSFYCVYDLHCESASAADVERVKALFHEASEAAIDAGAFFDRPYGVWADMMYRRSGNYAEYLKKVKAQLDPNNIMNPGKLCF